MLHLKLPPKVNPRSKPPQQSIVMQLKATVFVALLSTSVTLARPADKKPTVPQLRPGTELIDPNFCTISDTKAILAYSYGEPNFCGPLTIFGQGEKQCVTFRKEETNGKKGMASLQTPCNVQCHVYSEPECRGVETLVVSSVRDAGIKNGGKELVFDRALSTCVPRSFSCWYV